MYCQKCQQFAAIDVGLASESSSMLSGLGLRLLVCRRQATVDIPDRGRRCVKIADPFKRSTSASPVQLTVGAARVELAFRFMGQHRNLELVRRTVTPFA